MTRRGGHVGRALRRFLGDTAGNATVEFVIIMPMLLTIVFSIYESGWLMTRSVMLERGLDLAIRDLRLGRIPNVSHDDIKARICDHAVVISDCLNVVQLELTPVANSASYPSGPVQCIDRGSDIEPVISFNPGSRSEIMFVRACAMVDPLFPMLGLGKQLRKDASGGYALISYSAFVNEPE